MEAKIRSAYGIHERVPFINRGKSRAKQSFKEECDINNILTKYVKTGVLEHIRDNKGLYIDLPDQMDYQEALDTVLRGREAFVGLPGSIRQRFENDPLAFLDFMRDPKMLEESYELGLRVKEPDGDLGPDLPAEEPVLENVDPSETMGQT